MEIIRLWLRLACMLWVICWSGQEANGQNINVSLTLNGVDYANNSIVTITDIGTDGAALLCTTTYSPCCSSRDRPLAQWYFPNGSQVLNHVPGIPAGDQPYYITRSADPYPRTVRLNRSPAGIMTGIFHCDIPDAYGVLQSLYVGIYSSTTGGQVMISGGINFQLDTEPKYYNSPVFTLTCTSTGGPATTVYWTKGTTTLSDDNIYTITSRVTYTETATYVHTLRVTGRQTGSYTCTVSNNRTSPAASNHLTVAVAGQPSNIDALAAGSTSIRVSWTAPTSGATVTGYQIHWITWNDRGSMDANAVDTAVTISGRHPGMVYTIYIVALSDQLPSLVVGPVTVALDVGLTLNGVGYANNSIVTRTDIGTGSAALLCTTTYSGCCSSANPETQWYFPNGSQVLNHLGIPAGDRPYYRTRSAWPPPQAVRLNRNTAGITTGIFHCDILDASGVLQSLYIGIYSSTTGGQVMISGGINFQLDSEPNSDSPVFTLTCTSTGGPATTVYWTKGTTTLSDDNNYTITSRVTYTETATYVHTLRVTGRQTGSYTCTVSNKRTSPAASNPLTVAAAHQPGNIDALAAGPTSIRVSWTAPTSGANVTGYRIYWSGGSDQGSIDANVSDTAVNICGRSHGMVYTISIVALSDQLPSPLVGPVTVTLAPSPLTTMANVLSATSVALNWTPIPGEVVNDYEVTFSYQGPCSGFTYTNTTTVEDTSSAYILSGLEEFSNYTISVTAVNDGGGTTQTQTVTTMSSVPSGPPQMVTATATGRTTISVRWNHVDCIHRNSDIIGYMVSYGQHGGESDSESVTVMGITDRTYTMVGLIASTQYFIMIAAMNRDVTGPFSNPILIETGPHLSVPGLVSSLQVTIASLVLPVTWDPPLMQSGNVTVYEVHYWDEEEGQEGGRVVNVTATSVELTGLRPESTYTISVRAYAAAGPGEEKILTVPATIASTSQALGSGSLAGAVVGACIGTALLYTVILLVVKFAVVHSKRHSTDMEMKECVAYGGVAVHSGAEEHIYDTPQ